MGLSLNLLLHRRFFINNLSKDWWQKSHSLPIRYVHAQLLYQPWREKSIRLKEKSIGKVERWIAKTVRQEQKLIHKTGQNKNSSRHAFQYSILQPRFKLHDPVRNFRCINNFPWTVTLLIHIEKKGVPAPVLNRYMITLIAWAGIQPVKEKFRYEIPLCFHPLWKIIHTVLLIVIQMPCKDGL